MYLSVNQKTSKLHDSFYCKKIQIEIQIGNHLIIRKDFDIN